MFECSANDVKNLVELQKNISSHMELEEFFKTAVKKIAEIDQKQLKADSLIKTVSGQLESMRKDYAANEAELKTVEDGIAKSNQKLAAVKHDQEYQSRQKEITDLHVKAHELNDSGLKLLEKLETAEKQFNAKAKDIETFLKTSTKQRAELEKKVVLAKKQLQKLDDSATKLKAEVDDYLLSVLEDNVRHNLNHLGVVKVEDAVCQGCNVNVPRQVFNELQKNQAMDMCPNCRRLIYWEHTE